MSATVARPTSRVVATGYGVITATATDRESFVRALRNGERGMAPVTLFDVSDAKTSLIAEVKGFDPKSTLPARLKNIASRSDALGLVAADEAVRHSGLSAAMIKRAGIVVGGTTGGMLESESSFAVVGTDIPVSLSVAMMFSHPLSSPADHIAFALGLDGPRRSVCTACSSGANAMAIASELLRRGDCDAVIAGGTDSVCRLTFTGFNALGAIDAKPCRPFDVTRAGLNLGEGAAFIVLERIEDAVARGARIYAELYGVGAVSEAHHITNPQSTGEGAARAMSLALADGGIDPSQIDYINAHGTATALNDAMEAPAIRTVLGASVERAYVSSTKSLIGHTLGAAGAIEAVVCLIAMEHSFIPPTAGLTSVDPKCVLRHVPEKSIEAKVDVCLSNSFGFGGNNTVICLGRPQVGDPERRMRPRSRGVVVTGIGALTSAGSGLEALDAALVRAPAPSAAPGLLTNIGPTLDATRARRLNRFGRIATDVVAQALAEAKFTTTDPLRVGAGLGTAWGSLDDTFAFMRRVAEKGARMAPPADFPNLVLSAGVGHLSIYHGFKGPTFTAIALSASGEAAVVGSIEEIVAGRADAMAAGAVEERNPLIFRMIDGIGVGSHARDAARTPRTEGAACVMLEAEEIALARGARPIARIAAWHQATFAPPPEVDVNDDGAEFVAAVGRAVRAVMASAPAGTVIDAVVVPLATPGIRDGLAAALQKAAPVYEVAPRIGFFEAIGAVVIAGAARLMARGDAPHAVLALGSSAGSVYALLLTRP